MEEDIEQTVEVKKEEPKPEVETPKVEEEKLLDEKGMPIKEKPTATTETLKAVVIDPMPEDNTTPSGEA